MKDTVSHYVPPHSVLTSTEPQVFSNNLTMPLPVSGKNGLPVTVTMHAMRLKAWPGTEIAAGR